MSDRQAKTAPFNARYYDGQQAVSHSAQVRVAPDGIHLSYQTGKDDSWDKKRHWSFARTHLQADPGHGRDVTLGHMDYPDARLLVHASDYKNHIRPHLPKQNQSSHEPRLWLKIGAIIGLLIFSVFFAIPALVPFIVPHIPHSLESRLGDMVFEQAQEKFPLCEGNAQAQAALDAMLHRLAQPIDDGGRFRAHVAQRDDTNAFALPGGHIVIFSGLLEKAESPDELAGVLAHEISHVVRRHGMHAMLMHVSQAIFIDVMTGGGGGAIYFAAQMNSLRYSRKNEMEADADAIHLLQQAKVDARGLLHFFARLEETEPDATKAKQEPEPGGEDEALIKDIEAKLGELEDYMSYLSTHPASKAREEMVKAVIGTYETAPIISDAQWQQLKAFCADGAGQDADATGG